MPNPFGIQIVFVVTVGTPPTQANAVTTTCEVPEQAHDELDELDDIEELDKLDDMEDDELDELDDGVKQIGASK